jgi:1,4-alpha-glucan branching enzyme
MKKIFFLLTILVSFTSFAQVTWQGGTNPEANTTATILFNKAGTPLATYTGTIYAHTGVTLNNAPWQNVIGNWGNNSVQPSLTLVSGTTYKLDLTPSILAFYGVGSGTVTKINMVFRNAAGNSQTADLELNVGSFQASLDIPEENTTTILNSGDDLTIVANNTNGNASYNLIANGVSINSTTDVSYIYTDTNITTNKNYELQITQGTTTYSKKFYVIVNPPSVSQAIPSGKIDGINYDSSDPTKAILVLDAPGKDFVYVAGSFNNWQPDGSYAMKKDVSSSKFWIELTGLTPSQIYSYQYWVVDNTPTANSPVLVKTADPYSTLVLSSYDDPWISPTVYPNLPAFPTASGQEREVTVLQTGQTPYSWSSATTNFVKPSKDKLVVYELLVRDFDSNRSYQNLIDRIDYFKNLKINAIELMPVMEFDGNESWGYNTSFHLANDKAYGPADKLREFIDLCHQNGIAVILDVALNHAFGRNPMNRMWMNDPDGDGWGSPATDNPYFNTTATHSYSVGNDFNHQQQRTKNYVKRVIKHWTQEYKIDGFRWDLTKGFTQNCTGSDACTNGYQQDRVDVLKEYVDYAWTLDPTQYEIFEHLGIDSEEQQWANYRVNETPSKGVMMWGKVTDQYNQLSMGYNSNNDITRMGHTAHGFSSKKVIGYAESHDEERLMYKNLTFGNNTNAGHNVRNLNTALSRMSAIGAISLLVPGPKMIWHFGDLGWDLSIFTCSNGTLNTQSDAITGDCKLDNKPQPQWVNNWLGNSNRNQIYNDWAKMIDLKKNEAVFSGDYSLNSGTTLTPKLYVYDNSIPSNQLKNVVILTNFDVNSQNVVPNFPYTGTWYNLMDNSPLNVTNTTDVISIAAGQFKIYGNALPTLANDNFTNLSNLNIAPNPANNYFTINKNIQTLEIYSITGQLIKSFKNQFENYQYSISDLTKGIYLVKVKDDLNNEKTLKLIKE